MSIAIQNGKPTAAGFGAILSVFLILGSLSIFSAALRVIGMEFPDAPQTTISLCSTLPGICCIPTVLLSGWLVDRGVKFKPIIIVGVVCYLLTGLMPLVANNSIEIILASRVLFGLALGITTPLANAAVLRWYTGNECAKKVGQGVAAMMLGTVLFQVLSGYLAAIDWRCVCLLHLIGIIPLVWCLIAWPEPEKVIKKAKEAAQVASVETVDSAGDDEKINPRAIWTYLAFWLNCAMVSVLFVNSSYFIALKGLGESVVAGYFGASVTFVSFICGLLFGAMFKKLGRYTIGVGLICSGVGMLIVWLAPGLVTLMLGAAVVGVGFSVPQAALATELGLFIPKKWVSLASGFQMIMKHLGNFLAGYFITLVGLVVTGADSVTVVIAAAIVSLAVGIIFCVVRVFKPLPETKE